MSLDRFPHAPRNLDIGDVRVVRFTDQAHAIKGAIPKARPAIVVGIDGDQVTVHPITRLASYADGHPRLAIPPHPNLGLDDRKSYLWSQTPTVLTLHQIGMKAGYVTMEVAELLAEVTCPPLSDDVIDHLRRAATLEYQLRRFIR